MKRTYKVRMQVFMIVSIFYNFKCNALNNACKISELYVCTLVDLITSSYFIPFYQVKFTLFHLYFTSFVII